MRRRLCTAYHMERSIAQRLGLPEYPCACNRCRGARIKKVETVARHHSAYGRDPYLIYPVMVSKNTQEQKRKIQFPEPLCSRYICSMKVRLLHAYIANTEIFIRYLQLFNQTLSYVFLGYYNIYTVDS